MPQATVHTTNPPTIEIEYDTHGSPDDPALLLIMGFTAQMTAWEDDFCKLLADRGRIVIRFDNRDCGLSTKLDGVAVDFAGVLAAAFGGAELPPVPYTLPDMVNDAVGLLDHLSIDRAHVAGVSMGGMIAQTMAIDHPERVATLTSIMSAPGDPEVGQATPEAQMALFTPPPADRDGYIEAITRYTVFTSKKYTDVDKLRARAAAAYDRSYYPEGGARQMAAIVATGDRSAALTQLDVPTLVIHGRDDTLITPGGGTRTAELIPGAELLMLDDMGHDLPEPLWPVIVDAVIRNTERAGAAGVTP
jgi:pimeloyl-ACP methyl ester carboxylesterase